MISLYVRGGFDDDSLSPPHHEPLVEPEEEQEVVNEELQALPEDDAQLAVSGNRPWKFGFRN